MQKKLDELKEILQEKLQESEIIVDEITFKATGNYQFLTIVLDKVGGIDLDTIVEATHEINPLVDKYWESKTSYILDVISKERG